MTFDFEPHRCPEDRWPEDRCPEDRWLCGWRVASGLPLPELLPWTGEERAPDLTIRLGPVPERLADPRVELPRLQVAADGACRIAVPGVAAYLVAPDGTGVTIAPAPEATVADIRLFLLGTVFAALCYRRGLVPLHASCVRVGDRAVALAGASGIGKSTLAAALLRRGHAVLTDDVTVVDTTRPGGPLVLPTFPRLRLWRDAMARLDFPTEGAERSRAAEKFHQPLRGDFCARPLPLAAVFHLEPAVGGDSRAPRRLTGAEGLARLGRDLYRARLPRHLGVAERTVATAAALGALPGGLWVLAHGHDAGGLDRSVAAVLERAGP